MSSPSERILIPHIDDVGMCHGANVACLDLMGKGFVTTASVMVPCPWFPEIAAAYRGRRDLDLGVHLTLTSEWTNYRWRPLIGAGRRSGLVDQDGYMWRNVPLLRQNLDVVAAEEEMTAQIERALGTGLDPTHLDAHMGAAAVPELVGIYRKLGKRYRLPILLPREIESYLAVLKLGAVGRADLQPELDALEAEGGQFVDRFIMTPFGAPASADHEAIYRQMVADVPAGVTFFSLHANASGDIEVIDPGRDHLRTNEHRLGADPAFHRFLAEQGIELMGFRALRERYRAAS